MTIAGWGVYNISEQSLRSNVLRRADIRITIKKSSCKNLYRGQHLNIIKSQLCVGGDGIVDSCQADSGGPLMIISEEKWHVVGIVSFGFGCGIKNWPSIYTDVFSYINWIQDKIKS